MLDASLTEHILLFRLLLKPCSIITHQELDLAVCHCQQLLHTLGIRTLFHSEFKKNLELSSMQVNLCSHIDKSKFKMVSYTRKLTSSKKTISLAFVSKSLCSCDWHGFNWLRNKISGKRFLTLLGPGYKGLFFESHAQCCWSLAF